MTKESQKRPLYIPYAGPVLLETPLLNKGSAFTTEERKDFNLEGLLPHYIETIEEQHDRAYEQFCSHDSDMARHIFLRSIQDTNETLYFSLITRHLEEMMPIIYTPTVGEACQNFSQIYRRKRGLFISYQDRDILDRILRNATKQNIKVIVVTDGERVLGLGDQGIGGMGISIGKLALYSACGGISPAHTLPITLDVGCNNEELINDPMYMGMKQPRIDGEEYDAFLETFIAAVHDRWPAALIQFEDFAQPHAMPLLKRYQNRVCCFNDDIQGTAAVTVGTLIAACRSKDEQLKDQRVVFVGSGSAGCGIAEHVVAQMKMEGASEEQARSQIFMIDRHGLLTDDLEGLVDFQKPLTQKLEIVAAWKNSNGKIGLLETINGAKPTVLIGVSGQPGLFTEEAIRAMASHVDHPIIFPLSNPTSQVEAFPKDVVAWSDGKAIIATGSPFGPVEFKGSTYEIAQCNNSYIFPGIGLGVLAVKARRVTNNMLMASSASLASASPRISDKNGSLLPKISDIRSVSKIIAKDVAKQAIEDGVALAIPEEAIGQAIEANFWFPEYRRYERTSL
ncbi:NAD-dependent malic enzyme [Puniceicoccaceae bacterium K14]|nr:NAD-dependent malic enzyme [Puniceicoccaceae bacterium K14]